MELSICEIYPTIQGEGFLIGSPITLIRFQGCNIYCSWCDTKYAIPFKEEVKVSLEQLLEELKKIGRKHILLTGGEPFAHPQLGDLTEILIKEGYFVQIETNGTLWQEKFERLPRETFYISLSPKGSVDYQTDKRILKFADELKMVVDNKLTLKVLIKKDFLPLVKSGKLILQPEDNKERFLQKSLKLLDELLQMGYTARLIPQLHKLVNLP